jgi:hypothetical protein
VLPSGGSAQTPVPCAPADTADVHVSTRDKADGKRDGPLYATHEVALSAVVDNANATNVQITPQAGVTVLKPGSSGKSVDLVIPALPSLTITVSWEQPGCSASKTLSFPVLKPGPSTVKLVEARLSRAEQHNVTVIVRPDRSRPNLAPLELTLRTSSRAQLPSPHAGARRWSVPMRAGERKRYAKRLPGYNPFTSMRTLCRYWYFSCGAVFSQVNSQAPHGGTLQTLAFTQPSRWVARYGVLVTAYPTGRSPRRFGIDLQVRQQGMLLARYRRAGVCVDVPGAYGGVRQGCTVTAIRNFSR